MNKKTIIIVSVSLVLAILAVSIIATFPTYLFEESGSSTVNSNIQSGNVTESDSIDVGSDNGIESVLPSIDETDTELPEAPIETYKALAENDGAKLLGEAGAFKDGTKFNVAKLGILNKKYYRARHYVRDFANEYLVYNISASLDGKVVSPTGLAKLVLNIPKGFDLEQAEVYYMFENGGITKLNSVIDKNNRTATIDFTQSGVYILIEKDNKPTDNTSEDKNSSSEAVSSEENSSSTNSSEEQNSSSEDNNQSNTDSSESEEPSNPSTPDQPTESDPNRETMDGWVQWY